MPEPWCDGITAAQEDRIKRAVESTCELCHEYTPPSRLSLHGISGPRKKRAPDPKGRECNILVVCEACHRLIHKEPVPVKKLRARISGRPFDVRRQILAALGYVPRPVTPPEDQDFARVYDDTLKDYSGHYR